MRKTKTEKGITLVALIITIVVLLILAAVAINAITEYNIIENANSAAQKYGNQASIEDETLGGYSSEIDKYMGGTTGENGSGGGNESGEESGNEDKTSEFIGCYADVDGNGTVDGIIFADLAFSKEGQWGSSEEGFYSYEAKDNLNNYTVRDAREDEKELFKGAKAQVIEPTGNSVEENDRFYVMALEDFKEETMVYSWSFTWFADTAFNPISIVTEVGFGTGKVNTNKMIECWNERQSQSWIDVTTDFWEYIQSYVESGWFISSVGEWSAFCDAFSINSENSFEYGMKWELWTSSQYDGSVGWYLNLFSESFEGLGGNAYSGDEPGVRFCTTF